MIEAMKLKVGQNMTDPFAFLESCFTGPWAMGEYSVADPYLYVLTRAIARAVYLARVIQGDLQKAWQDGPD